MALLYNMYTVLSAEIGSAGRFAEAARGWLTGALAEVFPALHEGMRSDQSAAGTQMRVTPELFKTSTWVFTSKVRQATSLGSSRKRRLVCGREKPAETKPAERRKSRRFIITLICPYLGFSTKPQNTPDFAGVQIARPFEFTKRSPYALRTFGSRTCIY